MRRSNLVHSTLFSTKALVDDGSKCSPWLIDDLDTMSLDDVYNHLKVYEPEIDDDDIEDMDIKWNLALLSMRADRFWKKNGKKITIQGSDITKKSRQREERESYKKDPKVEEPAPKAMIAIDDKDMKGVGFNGYYAVQPPPTQVYSPFKKDLSWMGLPEFVDDTVTDYPRPTPSIDVSKSMSKEQEEIWKNIHHSFFKLGGLSCNVVPKPMIKFVKESCCPSATKVNNTENVRKPIVKYAEMYKNTSQSPRVRGKQRNWNNQKSQQLGKDFIMQNKACYNCAKNKVWSPTVRPKIPTVGLKVPTAKPAVTADKGYKGKGIPQDNIDDKGYWDSGCFWHMTGNISYLSESEPFNGRYVSFGHGRGKITGKGSIKTGKLKFENAYFMEELKYNLFSNGVVERRNMTLIEAARTMLADAQLPATFWAEAVKTACYVQNMVLVTKPHNKTPCELFNERPSAIGFLRPFGCHVMILNTLDHLGKFDAKGDEGTSSTNILGTQEEVHQAVKEKESPLRFISLPNWFHELNNGGSSFPEPRSLGNAMSFENRLEDFFRDTSNAVSLNRVEVDLSNMETGIQVSLTPTLKIHKDHPKSHIIYPVDTPIQTRQKTKDVDEQSFIATIHQKTNPDLL
nr:retrovirus-related Pol polyprotein from transposon TNT 1-94 [Tanacetum cinerariifolium]